MLQDQHSAGLDVTLPDGDENSEANSTTPTALARLMEYDWDKYVALPVHTTLEVVEQPQVIDVPGCAYYGLGMLRWQDRYLPLLDLRTLLNAYKKPGGPPMRYALVVTYQAAPFEPVRYGAMAMIGLPQTMQVGDHMQAPLPSDSDLWPQVALSCFAHQQRIVPIVDTARLFNSSSTR